MARPEAIHTQFISIYNTLSFIIVHVLELNTFGQQMALTYSELDSQHNLKKICSRLSSHPNNKWRERVFDSKRKHMRYASFGEFVAFMKEKSDEANDPLYGQDSFSEQQASSNHPVASSMNCVSTLKSPIKCVLCDESHLLFKCTKFKNMDYDDRQSVVSRNKLCVNCLRPSHTVFFLAFQNKGSIDLLIGQDYADCFQPLELLKENKNEPYVVCIVGSLCCACSVIRRDVIWIYNIVHSHAFSLRETIIMMIVVKNSSPH